MMMMRRGEGNEAECVPIYLFISLHPSIHTMSELMYFMPFKP